MQKTMDLFRTLVFQNTVIKIIQIFTKRMKTLREMLNIIVFLPVKRTQNL